MAELSCIVPIYNAEKYLKKCVNSLSAQTFRDIEIILVDDGSTDKSGEICDRLQKKDSRINVIHQKNQGSIAARKNGLSASIGKYVCFCDADDTMPPKALEIMMNEIHKSGCDICIGRITKMWKGFKFRGSNSPCLSIERPKVYEREQFLRELYISWFGISNVSVSLCAKIYKSEIIKNAYNATPDLGIFLGDDLIVTLSAFPLAQSVVFVPETVYNYTVGGGTSAFYPNMLNEWIMLYNYKMPFAEKYIPESNARKYADIELCNMTFTYFEMLLDKGGFSREQFLQEAEKALARPEIKAACLNPLIDTESSVNVRLIRDGDIDVIYNTVRQRLDSTAAVRKIKKLMLKL